MENEMEMNIVEETVVVEESNEQAEIPVQETVEVKEEKAEKPAPAKKKRGGRGKAKKSTDSKASSKSRKTGVKSRVVSSTNKQVIAAVEKSKGVNTHFGLNDELPTFLL